MPETAIEAASDWLRSQISKLDEEGRNTKSWRAIASDARMAAIWPVIADWPLETVVLPLLSFAAGLAEPGIPAVLSEAPNNRVGLAWSQYCIGEAAKALVIELRTDPDTATRLLGTPVGPLVEQLQELADRALREADTFAAIVRQVSPGIAVQTSYDREPLAYREAIANLIDGLRRDGVPVTLAEQHRVVATFANVVFEKSGNTEIKWPAEERRWRRQNRTNRP